MLTPLLSPRPASTIRARCALALLPVSLLAALAGCAGAPDDAVGGGDGKAQASASEADFQSWSLKYASCMRDEGIDFPDPPSDPSEPALAMNLDDLGGIEVFEAADGVCQKKLGPPPVPEGAEKLSDEEMAAKDLELTQCLRKQGVEVEDAAPGEMLALPMDLPEEALEACGLSGFSSSAGVK